MSSRSFVGDRSRFAPLSDQPAGMSAIVIHPGSRLPAMRHGHRSRTLSRLKLLWTAK